jgi:hypothetical protein
MSKQSQAQHREEAREERAAAAAEKLQAAEASSEVVQAAPAVQEEEKDSAKLQVAREVLLRHLGNKDLVDALENFIRAVK